MENLIEDELSFPTKKIDIVREIENVKSRSRLNYIECVVSVCEKFDLEIESINEHLPKHIKEKIEADALELNLLKYKINTLV